MAWREPQYGSRCVCVCVREGGWAGSEEGVRYTKGRKLGRRLNCWTERLLSFLAPPTHFVCYIGSEFKQVPLRIVRRVVELLHEEVTHLSGPQFVLVCRS